MDFKKQNCNHKFCSYNNRYLCKQMKKIKSCDIQIFLATESICGDCSFVTIDPATTDIGRPVENVFEIQVRHLAKAYLKMIDEFNPTNKTLVRFFQRSTN